MPTKDSSASAVSCPALVPVHSKIFQPVFEGTLAAFAIDPSTMMVAATKQVTNFAMPGTGIPSFTRHAVRIAREGIYGLGQFLRDVVTPVLSLWDVDHLAGLNREAENARAELNKVVARISETVERMAQKAAANVAPG